MRKMWIFLPLLCFLCGAQVHSIFDGSCHRKDPPPGVLVLSPGSKLVLTCRGQVMVNGVNFNIARNNSSTSHRESSSVAPTTTGNNKHNTNNAVNEGHEAKVSTVTGKNRIPRHTDTGYKASPTSHMGQPTSVSRTLKDESDLEAEKMDGEGFYEEDQEEEEGADGRRVTRGITSSPQWKWNGRAVKKTKRDRGEIIFERRGTMLSLSSVRETDSGNYTCHHRGRVRVSLKVIVTEPPENPRLSCHKKSPSSKIRCEWAPQKPVSRQPDAYLVLRKRSTDTEFNLPCSYSSRLSRYWCALEHNEDDLRILHMAYLCVRNIAGSAISNILPFVPLDILKPNPPSDVKVQQKEGCETCLKVTWNFPSSWKPQDSYYYLVYELKYQPLMSIFYQIKTVSVGCSYTITDVMTGIEYLIQVRTKEEYDGHWSDWSPPVKAFSWTDPNFSHVSTTMFTLSVTEGSTDDYSTPVPTSRPTVPYHKMWICGSFLLFSLILSVHIFRHKDRFMSKLHHLNAITKCGNSSQLPPSAPPVPEGQALMTCAPPYYKKTLQIEEEKEEEENEEGQREAERTETIHFNNASYFLLQRGGSLSKS